MSFWHFLFDIPSFSSVQFSTLSSSTLSSSFALPHIAHSSSSISPASVIKLATPLSKVSPALGLGMSNCFITLFTTKLMMCAKHRVQFGSPRKVGMISPSSSIIVLLLLFFFFFFKSNSVHLRYRTVCSTLTDMYDNSAPFHLVNIALESYEPLCAMRTQAIGPWWVNVFEFLRLKGAPVG